MRAATFVQVLQDLFYVLLYVYFMSYFTCDRPFNHTARASSCCPQWRIQKFGTEGATVRELGNGSPLYVSGAKNKSLKSQDNNSTWESVFNAAQPFAPKKTTKTYKDAKKNNNSCRQHRNEVIERRAIFRKH